MSSINTLVMLAVALIAVRCDLPKSNSTVIELDASMESAAFALEQTDVVSLQSSSLDMSSDPSGKIWELTLSKPVLPNLNVYDSLYLPIYLEPGWRMRVSGDFTNLEELSYQGDGAAINNALLRTYLLHKQYQRPFYWQLNLEEFSDRLKTLKNSFNDIADGLGEDELSVVAHYFNSFRNMELLTFVRTHYDLRDLPSIPLALQSFDDVTFDETLMALQFGVYAITFNMYLDAVIYPPIWREDISEEERKKLSDAFPSLAYDAIQSQLQGDPFKQYLSALHIHKFLNFTALTPGTEKILDHYFTSFPDSPYAASLKQKVDRLAALDPGNPLPELRGLTAENDTVYVKDMYGRVIYIDIWATWCGPCIEEFPNSIVLREEYSEEDVVFLYLSVDANEEKWKKYLNENKQLQGFHLRSADAQRTYDRLQNAGIPRYLLIDENGLIANAWAPGPGSEEIRTLIDGLL